VSVTSELGRGSTFTMYFPTSKGVAVSAAPPRLPREAEPAAKRTILLVEDEEALRSLLRRVLEGHGYAVLEAANGDRAVERWMHDSDSIDLLLTDVVMPGTSGLELARALRESKPTLRVMLMSGYADPQLFRGLLLDDRTAIIQKPFLPRVLVEQVRRLLDVRPPGPEKSRP
jgi:two-component system cell cycle sensor histidine kinase/response regulator CckA